LKYPLPIVTFWLPCWVFWGLATLDPSHASLSQLDTEILGGLGGVKDPHELARAVNEVLS